MSVLERVRKSGFVKVSTAMVTSWVVATVFALFLFHAPLSIATATCIIVAGLPASLWGEILKKGEDDFPFPEDLRVGLIFGGFLVGALWGFIVGGIALAMGVIPRSGLNLIACAVIGGLTGALLGFLAA